MAAKDNQINLLPGKSLDGTMLPDMSYLDNIRKIAQGDLSSALTGGDKLIALSGLLRSVARGSRTTPQEAMAQVQQAALGRASTQMQLAQLEAAQAARLKQQMDAKAFSETIKDPAKRQTFLALPPEEQVKRMAKFTEDATPFGTKEANGKTFMIMSDQSTVELSGIPEDVKGEWRSYDINGDGIAEDVFTNTRTGKPIMNENQQALFVSPGMTAAQKDASVRGWAAYGLDLKRFRRGDGAGDSSGLLPEPKEVELNGKKIMMQWDKKSQRYVPFTQQNISKPSSGFRPSVPPSVGVGIRKPLIQQ